METANTTLKKNKVRGIAPPNFEADSKAAMIKTVWY